MAGPARFRIAALRDELRLAEFNYGVACGISPSATDRKPYADAVNRCREALRAALPR